MIRENQLAQALADPDRSQRRQLLMQIVRSDPGNGAGWYHLRQTLDDPTQIAECDRRIAAIGYQPPATPGFQFRAAPPSPQTVPLGPLSPTVALGREPPAANLSPLAAAMGLADAPPAATSITRRLFVAQRPRSSLASFWMWIGLMLTAMLLVCLVVFLTIRPSKTRLSLSGEAGVVGEQGVWHKVSYINNRSNGHVQTEFVRVDESNYTRTFNGLQLTVVWSVRNAGDRTVAYVGQNKYIIDVEGYQHRPKRMDPEYRLQPGYQSYPIKVTYLLPANTDMSKLVWVRYNDIDDSLTYQIKLSPMQQ